MLHAVGPVFQIDVYPHAPRDGLVDRSADVAEVLFGRAAELLAAVLERPFGQQVHNAASGVAEPVEGYAAVDEPQRLDAVRIAFGGGPLGDAPHGLLLALRDPRRSDLDAADAQFLQQQPGDGELFAGVERNARTSARRRAAWYPLFRPGEASSRGYFRAASNRRIWSEMLHR